MAIRSGAFTTTTTSLDGFSSGENLSDDTITSNDFSSSAENLSDDTVSSNDSSASAENLSDDTVSSDDSSASSSKVTPPSQTLTETGVGDLVFADRVPNVPEIDVDEEDLGDDEGDDEDYDDEYDELGRLRSSKKFKGERMKKMETRASEPRNPKRKRCPYCGSKPGCVHNKDRLGLKFRP